MEADTIFSIKQTGALLYILQPYLEERGINNSEGLKKTIRKKNLSPVIEKAYEALPGFTRMERFRAREAKVLERIEGFDRIPILVNGISLVDDYFFKKKGIDPYSMNHIFSNILLENISRFSEQCLSNFAFLYIQPTTYFQIPNKGLEDLVGSHTKGTSTSTNYSIPLSSYNPSLLRKDNERQEEVYLNRQLMAFKHAVLLEKLLPSALPRFRDLGIKEIPLYMEKGADSSAVIASVNNYTTKRLPFAHIGQGILTGTNKSSFGICDPTAIGRLLGFMANTCNEERQRFRPVSHASPIDYESSRHPFALIESSCIGRHPNLDDLVDDLRREDEEGYQAASSFASLYGLGFKRIELRLAELLRSDPPVYDDFRALSKRIYRWQEELEGKKVLTPDKIDGFFSIPSITNMKGHIRGSEFSLNANPHFDKRWLSDFNEGTIDLGCTVEKLISEMPEEEFLQILKANAPADSLIWEHYHPETMTPLPAIRGSFIHALSSDPKEGLVHYQTLKEAGIEPTSSDNYTETPFCQTHKGIRLSYHPDCYLFLEKSDSYDILILDTKTNRVTPYPEHKYLLQTFFYGWAIKQSVEEHLGLSVQNIYCVLNKCAFYKGFNGEPPDHTVSYRQQQYSPITRFAPDHFLHEAMPLIIENVAQEKDMLKTPGYFYQYKKGCSRNCFESNRIVCDYLAANEIEFG
ncbi:MAG: hypothetical protein ACLFP2_02625 [Candidatus Woesearchaeota archaeon]